MPLFKNPSANTSQRVMPLMAPLVRCPACHEDAVAEKKIHTEPPPHRRRRWEFTRGLKQLLCCCTSHQGEEEAIDHRAYNNLIQQSQRTAVCRACGFAFSFFPDYYHGRPGSDILDTDFKRPQHPVLFPLRPPSTAWVVRTGWTPQPDLLEKMDRVWCGECALFVEKRPDSGGCGKCGVAKEDKASFH